MFLTLYTPTYKRPRQLMECMASVAAQTLVSEIEHVIIADYVGLGVDGMYKRVPNHAPGTTGQYVYLLADDDCLADPRAVENLQAFVRGCGEPPDVIACRDIKGGRHLPDFWGEAPRCGYFDLGNMIVRGDVWRGHCDMYGKRYEGDFDLASYLWKRFDWAWWDYLFMVGSVNFGRPE
jgi:hypothetical protein